MKQLLANTDMTDIIRVYKSGIRGHTNLLLKDSEGHHCFLYKVGRVIALRYPDDRCPAVYPVPKYQVIGFSSILDSLRFLKECPTQNSED